MNIVCNDSVILSVSGNTISASNGDIYTVNGLVLLKNGQIVSMHVSNINEAVNVVIGLHGGRRL